MVTKTKEWPVKPAMNGKSVASQHPLTIDANTAARRIKDVYPENA
jgi:hypothetical protein